MNAINIGGGSGPSVESILNWCKDAEAAQAPQLRTDSRRSSEPVTAARVAIRQWANESAQQAAFDIERTRGVRTDSARIQEFALDLIAATASGLGMSERDGGIHVDGLRTDASWFAPGSLTSQSSSIIEPAYQPRMVSASIPTHTVEAWAMDYEQSAVNYAGKVAPYRPGMTDFPRADVQSNTRKRPVHSFVTSTAIDFMELMRGPQSQINIVERKAAAARIAFAEFKEQAIVNGIAGMDYLGLDQIGVCRYNSAVDYSSAATTMGAKYADLLDMMFAIKEAAGFRQGNSSTNAMLIGSRWAHLIRRSNNFDAGGSQSGMDLLDSVMRNNAALGQTIQSMGISRIIEAPNLDGFGGDPTRSAILFFDANNSDALRQVSAMTPAPVRTFQSLTGTETLYLMRDGGLDVGDALAISIATAKTA